MNGGVVCWWRAAALAVLVAAPAVHAQLGLFEPDAVEAAPASYVLDQADLFRHDTATLRRISGRLAAFDARHGMPVYLAVFGGLIGETVGSKAYDLQAAWLQTVRHMLASTEDVGERFAEEARRIHYGEEPQRGIRGQATPEERLALLEEGIETMSIPMPAALKGPVQ